MRLDDLSEQELVKAGGFRTEIDNELVEFAYKNLNHLPFGGKRDANYERMISGMHYQCGQEELADSRMRIRDILLEYGDIRMKNYSTAQAYKEARREYLHSFIGHCGKNIYMEHPFYFDYGFNTYIGDNFYANFDVKILDVGLVKIGNNVL